MRLHSIIQGNFQKRKKKLWNDRSLWSIFSTTCPQGKKVSIKNVKHNMHPVILKNGVSRAASCVTRRNMGQLLVGHAWISLSDSWPPLQSHHGLLVLGLYQTQWEQASVPRWFPSSKLSIKSNTAYLNAWGQSLTDWRWNKSLGTKLVHASSTPSTRQLKVTLYKGGPDFL